MTLLARRREELRRERTQQVPVEKRRSVAVRPPQPGPSFLHVQAALGNRATGSLLHGGAVLAKRRGEPLPADTPLSLDLRGGLADPELGLVLHLAQTLRPAVAVSDLGSATAEPVGTADRPRPGLLVPDGTAPGPGQMTRSAFLAAMRDAAREAAERGLAGTGHTARGCPWIEHYFRFYQRQRAERIEADLLRYVPAAQGAANARELLAQAAEHVRASVLYWAKTGELSGVPRGLPGMGLIGALAGSLAEVGRLLARARTDGPAAAAPPATGSAVLDRIAGPSASAGREAAHGDQRAANSSTPAAVEAQLGSGRPLDSSARSRMELAFGLGLGGVRIHTDVVAARLADGFKARAFAVGRHLAFNRGEYQPGTPVGDALLAHELAHVAQQRFVGTHSNPAQAAALERDADAAAATSVVALWSGSARPHGRAAPRLRSGLSLHRCEKERIGTKQAEEWVELAGGHPLTRHGDEKRNNPVWNRGSTDHAAAFTIGASPSLNARLRAPAALTAPASGALQIRVTEAGSVRATGTATRNPQGFLQVAHLPVAGLTDSDRVRARDYDLIWEASTNGTNWLEVQRTEGHRIYWLFANPRTSPLYTTAVVKGTRYAEGQQTPDGVAAALRSGPRRIDDLEYNPGDPINDDPLTIYDDGVGICTDYANLLTLLARSFGLDAVAVLAWGGFASLGRLIWVTLAGEQFINLINVRSPNEAFNPPQRRPFSPHGWAFNYHAVSRINGTLHDAALDRVGFSAQAAHQGKIVHLLELASAGLPPATQGTPYNQPIRRRDHVVQLTTQDFGPRIRLTDFQRVYAVPVPAGAASIVDVAVTWALAGGVLPPGLALDAASGRLTGTPTAAGSFSPLIRLSRPDGFTHASTVPLVVQP